MDNNYIVYMHTNMINNKRYIGITHQTVERRWGKNGSGYTNNNQPLFARAIKKYGWDNFKHEILYEGLSCEEASSKEIELIEYYDTRNPEYGYNIQAGGNLGNYGRTFSDESKQKMSISHKGRKMSEEQKKKISESLKGHKPAIFTPDVLERLRKFNTGKKLSEDTKRKISNTLAGVKKSEETKKKMSENHANCVSVFCPELDRVFKSIAEASKVTGVEMANIGKCLKGERKSAGKHPVTGDKLHWIKVENDK